MEKILMTHSRIKRNYCNYMLTKQQIVWECVKKKKGLCKGKIIIDLETSKIYEEKCTKHSHGNQFL